MQTLEHISKPPRPPRGLGLALLLTALAWSSLGCRSLRELGRAEPRAIEMMVVFEVAQDGRLPVAGARISAPPRELGSSDSQGRLRARLRGRSGERVSLEVRCPAGYYTASAPTELAIRPLLALAKSEQDQLRVPIACEPAERSIALLVRAETQSNLAVLARGREVARTDADGIAHVLLFARPGEEIAVELSTADAPELRPQNPRRQFRVENRDEVFVMNEKFTLRRPPARHRPKLVRPPEPELPYAL